MDPVAITINQYVDTLNNPYGLFRTLGEISAQRDVYGRVMLTAGNNSAVFRIANGYCYDDNKGSTLMLKCYIKQQLHSKEIYDFLSTVSDSLLTPSRLLLDEIYIYDIMDSRSCHNVVVAQWVEGNTLEMEIRRAAMEFETERFAELSSGFENLAEELLQREWAHGDLKPENIIVRPDGSMAMIDYDAMFIPSLAGETTQEVGTVPYQHPLRDKHMYNKHIDDYSIAIIAVSLRALALDETLYEKYNRSDNIILCPVEIFDGSSQAYDDILRLFALRGAHYSYNLALCLKNPTPHIPMLKGALTTLVCNENDSARGHTTNTLSLMERNGLWGYLDGSGREIIPPIYSRATEFSEGLALVQLHGVEQIIDSHLEVVMFSRFDSMKPFSCGVAAVKSDKKWGYIDRSGELVVELRFDDAGSMREGFAAVKLNDKWGYIDKTGKLVVPHKYDHALGFRDGVAKVYIGDTELNINCS